MEKALRCAGGHSYDIAREGYVNLLLAHHKASALPGDTKAMVQARRAFLDAGHYQPLSDAINALVGRYSAGSRRVLDAGCGEGYFLYRLQGSLPDGTQGYGLDISREAVRQAAARYKGSAFAVGSIHQDLPFANSELDVIVNIFAPRNPPEFARVLRPGGMALVVVPAAGHLAALHDVLGLAWIDGGKAARAVADFAGALTPAETQTLRCRRLLSPEDIVRLVQMTPTFWQLSEAAQASLGRLPEMEIEFAFTLTVLCKSEYKSEYKSEKETS